MPSAAASRASSASRRIARSRPAGPSSADQVASSHLARPGNAMTSPSRSVTYGDASRTERCSRGSGGPPSNGGRGPTTTERSMTARSRSGSIGGFVTWANDWRR